MEYTELRNGVKMPLMGYGVYQVSQEECTRCVSDALAAGYRSIDTAQSYFNEEQVGAALKASGIARDELFVTTKVWIEHYGYESTLQSVEESLRKLRCDHVDLLLLHQDFGDVYGAWRALETMYDQGKARAIGVSNFLSDRLVDIASFARIAPMVNQVELHPRYQQTDALEWMEKYRVQPEAWAPLGEGRGGLFENPELVAIAQSTGKTVAQVMLRWNIQRGVVVIPKSVHRERMEENLDVFDFELSLDQMNRIAALDTDESAFFSFRDPTMVEWFAKMVKERKQNKVAAQEEKAW